MAVPTGSAAPENFRRRHPNSMSPGTKAAVIGRVGVPTQLPTYIDRWTAPAVAGAPYADGARTKHPLPAPTRPADVPDHHPQRPGCRCSMVRLLRPDP